MHDRLIIYSDETLKRLRRRRQESVSDVLLLPLLLGLVISLGIVAKAKSWWPVRIKAILAFGLYLFSLGVLYFPSNPPMNVAFATLTSLGTSFTNAVAYFSGEELWGQLWLCSLVAEFTIGFTRTRIKILRNVLHLLDLAVYVGIIIIFLWKMGIMTF
jgi:hypothetical protein